MIVSKFINKNYESWSSLVIISLGLITVLASNQYQIGTLSNMGPGYFPLTIGFSLLVVGLLLLFSNGRITDTEIDSKQVLNKPIFNITVYKSSIYTATSILAFIFLVQYLGFVIASFALVFIAAFGDKHNNFKASLILAVVVSAVTTLVFGYALNLQLDLFVRV